MRGYAPPSRPAHEKAALDHLREGMPEHEPWRAWSNFDFVAFDGSIYEVDLFVIYPVAFFLVEIKGNPW